MRVSVYKMGPRHYRGLIFPTGRRIEEGNGPSLGNEVRIDNRL